MLDIGNQSSGDFTPWIKYNAKAGRWYIKGENGDVEVSNPEFVADFANIKTGWFYYAAGQAPERVLDPSLSQRAPKPDRTFVDNQGKTKDCFKRGFVLNCFAKSLGGVVELSSTADAISQVIGQLYSSISENEEFKAGKVPVLKVTGANPVTGKHGTNYAPAMTVSKYIDRPADLNMDAKATAPKPSAQPTPAASAVSEF